MSTTDDPRSATRKKNLPSGSPRNGRFRFNLDQFSRLDEMGFFDDRHVELIEGNLFERTSKPPHTTALELGSEALKRIFGAGWYVRHAQPLDMGRRSFLEPDLAVVPGSIRDYSGVHPKTAALVVEVSDATLRKDRKLKAHVYARAKLVDYWIVNLIERQLDVYRGPGPDPARRGRFRFRFANVTILPESGTISPSAAPDALVAVADLLP